MKMRGIATEHTTEHSLSGGSVADPPPRLGVDLAGAPGPVSSRTEALTGIVEVRLTEEEFKHLQSVAFSRKMAIPDLIRQTAIKGTLKGVRRGQGRTVTTNVRFTQDEMDRVLRVAAARGCSFSDLVRRAVAGMRLPEPPRPLVEREMVAAVNRLGANLWRLVRTRQDLREAVDQILAQIEIVNAHLAAARGEE